MKRTLPKRDGKRGVRAQHRVGVFIFLQSFLIDRLVSVDDRLLIPSSPSHSVPPSRDSSFRVLDDWKQADKRRHYAFASETRRRPAEWATHPPPSAYRSAESHRIFREKRERERDGEEGKKEKREIKEGAHHHLSERNSRPPAERESCWVDSKVRPNSLTTALRLPAN